MAPGSLPELSRTPPGPSNPRKIRIKPLKSSSNHIKPFQTLSGPPKPPKNHQNPRKTFPGPLPELSWTSPGPLLDPSRTSNSSSKKNKTTLSEPPKTPQNLQKNHQKPTPGPLPASSRISRLRNFVTFVLGAVAGTQLCCAVG